MHQSSLGSLLVVLGVQIHPLWRTLALPLIYLLSAVTIGYAVVLFESCLAAAGYRRKLEMHILTPLSKVMLGLLCVFLAVRWGDLIIRGAWVEAFKPTLEAFMVRAVVEELAAQGITPLSGPASGAVNGACHLEGAV